MADAIFLTVKERGGTVFEGEVTAVSGNNPKGRFDILRMHANFISLVEKVLTIKLKDGSLRELPVNNGIIKVRENKVEVFLGIKK